MGRRGQLILLVEDNPMDAELALRALGKNDLKSTVAVVHDGQEALEFLLAEGRYAERAAAPLPDLILLDLNLPKIDGIEVLRRIRSNERTRRIPVVILTSSTEDRDLVNGYDAGCNSYVQKPVDFNAFVSAAGHLSQYWLALNELPPNAPA